MFAIKKAEAVASLRFGSSNDPLKLELHANAELQRARHAGKVVEQVSAGRRVFQLQEVRIRRQQRSTRAFVDAWVAIAERVGSS